MMFSNIRSGVRICRACSVSSIRAIGGRTTALEIQHRMYNGSSRFYSFDVAEVIGSPREADVRSGWRQKTAELTGGDGGPVVQPSEIPHWVKTPIDLAIFKAQNSEDLWTVAMKYQLNGSQAVGVLASLAKFGQVDDGMKYEQIASLPDKDAFDHVVKSLLGECETLAVGDVLLALRSLLALDAPADAEIVVRLRKKLLASFYLLRPSTLIAFAIYHSKYAGSSEIGQELQTKINDFSFRRIKELSDPNDVLMLLSLTTRQDSGPYRVVETKLLELLPSFSGEQICRLVNVLASKRIRSLPLLKAIANRYPFCEEDLSVKKLTEFLTDLGTLNFPNMKILNVLLNDIEPKVSTITKPAVVVGVFRSLASMRLRSLELLERLCSWTAKRIDSFSTEELASVLIALARCNYTPDNLQKMDLIDVISNKLTVDKFEKEKSLYLDVVWSLAILGRLTVQRTASVLDKSFYEPLLQRNSGNDYKQLLAQLKLRNINAAAELEVKDYKGPFLDTSSFKESSQVNMVHYKQEAVKLMTDALHNLAPREKYMKTNVQCPEGYVIDALVRIKNDGRPVPVHQWDSSSVRKSSWPVAIIVRHFNEITQMSSSTVGLHAMAIRHLSLLHYLVLEIPASDIEQRRQALSREEFLKRKLNEIVSGRVPH